MEKINLSKFEHKYVKIKKNSGETVNGYIEVFMDGIDNGTGIDSIGLFPSKEYGIGTEIFADDIINIEEVQGSDITV